MLGRIVAGVIVVVVAQVIIDKYSNSALRARIVQ